MNRPHSHRNLLWSGHWPVVFHKQTGTLLYSLFVSWSFYWQSNGRVDGFTMCTLSDAYCRRWCGTKLRNKYSSGPLPKKVLEKKA